MPDAELRRQQSAYRRGLLRATAVFGIVLTVVSTLAATALWQYNRATQQERAAVAGRRALRLTLYAAQMSLAQRELEVANRPRAEEMISTPE